MGEKSFPYKSFKEPERSDVGAFTKQPVCHTGNIHVFDLVDDVTTVEFWAGGTSRGSVHTPDFLLVALQSADDGDSAPVRFKNVSMPSLLKYTQIRLVHIDIPDGAQPGFPLVFWNDFVQELWELAQAEEGHKLKVLVRCAGGHGRTGTVLAALAVATNVCPGVDPVAWVRKTYCALAIETAEQIAYIESLSGIKSQETPRPFPGTFSVKQTMTQGGIMMMRTTSIVSDDDDCLDHDVRRSL